MISFKDSYLLLWMYSTKEDLPWHMLRQKTFHCHPCLRGYRASHRFLGPSFSSFSIYTLHYLLYMSQLLTDCEVAYILLWTDLWKCRKIFLYTALAFPVMALDFTRYTRKNSNSSNTKCGSICICLLKFFCETQCPFAASDPACAYHRILICYIYNQKQMYLLEYLLYIFRLKEYLSLH